MTAQAAPAASIPGLPGVYPPPGYAAPGFMPVGPKGMPPGAAALPPHPSPGSEALLDMPIAYHERGELPGSATRPLSSPQATSAEATVEAKPVQRWLLGLVMAGVLAAIAAAVAILAGFL